MSCRVCGATVEASARFCPQCGTGLTLSVDERRVVTVLFADLVGFTALSEELDPERVKNLVDGCFRRLGVEIAAFGGRVDKIVGDALVALFGAPVAHEDDAERAVRAALRLNETVGTFGAEAGLALAMRVGVNTGEVLVGAVGGSGGDYTAMGDVVNTASRLQALGQPGWVVVGGSTYAATRDAIGYEAIGDVQLKGRAAPVDAWRAVQPLGLPGQRARRSEAPLVGRDSELTLLKAAVDHAVGHRRSHLLMILGDAGTGKGRLASELGGYAQTHHDATVLTGRCVPYGEEQDWFAIADAVRSGLGIDAETSGAEAAEVITAAVHSTHAGIADEGVAARTVTGLLHILGYETPLRSIDPERAATESHRAIRTALAATAERAPLVFTLADLHWADRALLDLVDALLAHLLNLPFVIVATARHSLLDDWVAKPGRSTVVALSLDPLSDLAAAKLVDQVAGPGLDETTRAELIARAGGNPLFIEELAATVRDGGEVDLGSLPQTLRSFVAARLDGLSDDERRVLEDASVLGRRGPITGLVAMGEEMRGDRAVPETIASLVSKDLLASGDGWWEFRANLVREVAYDRLPKADRARRHAGVAEYLSDVDMAGRRTSSLVAHHFRRAAELIREVGPVTRVPADIVDRAIEATIAAARSAETSASMERAARQYGEALELAGPDHPRWIEIALLQVRTQVLGHQLAAARLALDELSRRSLDASERATYTLLRAEVAQTSGDLALAVSEASSAVDQYRALGDRAGVGAALRVHGMTRLFDGDHDGAESMLESALVEYEAIGDRVGTAWALQNLAWISFARGRADEAEGRIDRALESFLALGDQNGVSWTRALLGYVRMFQGRFAESRALGEAAIVEARSNGDQWAEGMMLELLASIDLWSGDTRRAETLSAEAVRLLDETGDVVGRSFARALRGRSLVHVGAVAEAFELWRSTLESRSGSGVEGIVVNAAILSAALLGDETALSALPEIDEVGARSVDSHEGERRYGLALLAVQAGRQHDAEELLKTPPVLEGGLALSTAAIVHAAAGDRLGAEVAAKAVMALDQSTYIDRTLAMSAVAAARAGAGDATEALAALTEVELAVSAAPEDCVVAHVLSWAQYTVAEALDDPDSERRLLDAEERSTQLGLGSHGWRAALARIAASASP